MLPVKDIVKAHDPHTNAFGFTKTFQNGDPVGFMILERDEAELHLTLQPHPKAASFNVAHMMVDDADAPPVICQRYGLRVIKTIQNKDYGLRAFVFEDPDGNRIGVGRPILNRQTGSRGAGRVRQPSYPCKITDGEDT